MDSIDNGELLPKVIVLSEAWQKITKELDRAAQEGLNRTGSPDEAVFLPLCALIHRPGQLRAPQVEQTQLSDIETVVVAEALIPPQEMVDLSAVRIRFRPSHGSWEQTQASFDVQLDASIEKCSRLNLLARGHSHPFDCCRTRPSGPDRSEHLTPCLRFNRTLGIDAGFTFIAVRAREGKGWALHCFATHEGLDVQDLGLAELPDAENPIFTLPPYYDTQGGRVLEISIRENLGSSLTVERLPLGWTRFRITPAEGPRSVLALPPDFPAALGRRFVFAEGVWSSHDVMDWRAYLPLPAEQKRIAEGVVP